MLSRVAFGPPLVTKINEHKQEFLARARKALIQVKGIQ